MPRPGRLTASCLGAGACLCLGSTFVAAPRQRGEGGGASRPPAGAKGPSAPLAGGGREAHAADAEANKAAAVLLLSLAAGLGTSLSPRQRARDSTGARRLVQRPAGFQADWLGKDTRWGDIEGKSILDLEWRNVHGVFSISSIALFAFQIGRILLHQAPSIPEVWVTTAIYLPWTFVCWQDTAKLEEHYRVTFYASCGWAVMSLASLHSVVYQKAFPDIAFGVLAAGNLVFAASCAYFYSYHWSRMWRHYQQDRFRPLWIPGLLGLMLLHGLTIVDFAKRVDDMGWWKTVCVIYPDEWWWVADVRIIELFVTAAALWLIILHIQGVFTGMKNAALVVIGTIFAPLVLMVLESTWLRASSWQHYFMVGPKYF